MDALPEEKARAAAGIADAVLEQYRAAGQVGRVLVPPEFGNDIG
jgi:hypothetical protein